LESDGVIVTNDSSSMLRFDGRLETLILSRPYKSERIRGCGLVPSDKAFEEWDLRQ